MTLFNARTAGASHRFSLTAVAMSAVLAANFALAAPGAHGPNGEHLDAPAQATGGTTAPKVEAKSELFELVATLHSDELSILIDRYETNEPVLNAKVEVESGRLKAAATFHADHGDYAVVDPAFLKALAAKGEHALVFTVSAGPDSDLLDATLVTSEPGDAGDSHSHSHADEHGHSHGDAGQGGLRQAAWTGAAVLGVGAMGLVAWLRQRKRGAEAPVGGERP